MPDNPYYGRDGLSPMPVVGPRLRRDVIQHCAQYTLETLNADEELLDLVLDDMGLLTEDGFVPSRNENEEFYTRLNAIQIEVLLEALHQSVPYYGRPRE
jgi:hypothetical protein